MPDPTLKAKAIRFLRLHKGPRILLLPNAWDAASARIFEAAGASAIGTSSAGVAFSLGYPDGQRIPPGEMLAAIRRIAGAVSIPVTADVESGYGDIAETVRAVIDSGAVGLNLEDAKTDASLYAAREQADRVQAAREEATAAGLPLVINARTDVYWQGRTADPTAAFEETLSRLTLYRDAGADCLFVPGLRDLNVIAKIARSVNAPLNVLAGPDMPASRDLENIGVARLSLGSGPMRAAMGLMRRIGQELFEQGTCKAMFEDPIPYRDLNDLMR